MLAGLLSISLAILHFPLFLVTNVMIAFINPGFRGRILIRLWVMVMIAVNRQYDQDGMDDNQIILSDFSGGSQCPATFQNFSVNLLATEERAKTDKFVVDPQDDYTFAVQLVEKVKDGKDQSSHYKENIFGYMLHQLSKRRLVAGLIVSLTMGMYFWE